jgi:hypothetical protein
MLAHLVGRLGRILFLCFQLMNGAISGPKARAQLAADCSQNSHRNARISLRQCREVRHGQYEAYEILVSDDRGRALASIENGKFAKNGTGSEGRQTNGAVGRLEKRARCPLGQDKYLPTGVAFTKDHVAVRVRSTLQVRLDCRQVQRTEICQQPDLWRSG